MDVKLASEKIAELTLMKFFPAEKQARAALVQMVCGMATTNEQVDWLVRRALALYNEWPGPRELRALFCSRWKPRDGIEARSTVYLADETGGGFPSEAPRPAPALTPGRDEARRMLSEISTTSLDCAAPTTAGRGKVSFPAVRPIPIPPPPIRKPEPPTIARAITQADVDRAVRQHREAAGHGELHPEDAA